VYFEKKILPKFINFFFSKYHNPNINTRIGTFLVYLGLITYLVSNLVEKIYSFNCLL